MPFTTQEKAEALKTVQASKLIESGCVKLAKIIEAQPDSSPFLDPAQPTKAAIHFALGSASHQLYWLNVVEQNLLWVFENNSNGRTDRATNIGKAWTNLDSVINQLTNEVISRTKRFPEFASAGADFQAAIDLLKTVDRTLPYAEPFPTSYPRIIGPHGHYEMAQTQVAFMQKYLTDFAFIVGAVFGKQNWPNSALANKSIGLVLANLAHARASWNRIFCLQGEVVLPEDQKSADFDFAASSGLRPPSFFLALIAHELAMLDVKSQSFSGRFVPPGVSSFYRDILNTWRHIIAELLKVDVEFVRQDHLNAGGSPFTISQFWGKLDTWSQANLGFFFEIPAPPGQQPAPDPEPCVIPLGKFVDQTNSLDFVAAQAKSVAAQVEQIKADLKSMEGQPL